MSAYFLALFQTNARGPPSLVADVPQRGRAPTGHRIPAQGNALGTTVAANRRSTRPIRRSCIMHHSWEQRSPPIGVPYDLCDVPASCIDVRHSGPRATPWQQRSPPIGVPHDLCVVPASCIDVRHSGPRATPIGVPIPCPGRRPGNNGRHQSAFHTTYATFLHHALMSPIPFPGRRQSAFHTTYASSMHHALISPVPFPGLRPGLVCRVPSGHREFPGIVPNQRPRRRRAPTGHRIPAQGN
jgi:hypothetical protein